MQPGRTSQHRYVDPLAQIWLDAAARIGLRVVRGAEAYASTDGNGTLTLAVAEALDPDDSLAQMIFHELCHSLVQGLESFDRPDWGLENVDDGDAWREHACLRLQAVLAGRHGLRRFLAPTTDYRGFYDALPADPLAPRRDPSVVAAVLGLQRAEDPPWAPALAEALAATAAVAGAVAALRPPATASGAPDGALPTLWNEVAPRPALHPTGRPLHPAAIAGGCAERCGGCGWHYQAGPGRPVDRCQQTGDRIDPSWPACERWEPAPDCQECGACCREAYQSVTITRRELVRRRHPEMVVDRGSYLELARSGERCAALEGGAAAVGADGRLATTPYACRIYADRPRTCRDFTAGSDHCLTARRRVGLSI
jgi:hypothetical protein